MALQVFIQNPDSGEPWSLCGEAKGNWELLTKVLGQFVQAEVDMAADSGEKEITINIKLVEMTVEEVEALPDI